MNDRQLQLFRPVAPHYEISSPFGERIINGVSNFHKGIDFKTPVGIPVAAMAPGIIFRSGWENPDDHEQGFGFRIWQEIKLDEGRFYLWYGHLDSIKVKDHEYVQTGQIIGHTGNTGHSTGPHLHVGCRKVDTSDWYDMEFYA